MARDSLKAFGKLAKKGEFDSKTLRKAKRILREAVK